MYPEIDAKSVILDDGCTLDGKSLSEDDFAKRIKNLKLLSYVGRALVIR